MKNRSKRKKDNHRYLTENIYKDYLNNEAEHIIYSREKQMKLLRTLKLVFYKEEQDEKIKQKYLEYYMEENPNFKEKYLSASEEEKQVLLNKAIVKAQKAYDDFVAHNFRLVVSEAVYQNKKYSFLNIETIDLIQEGNIGMLDAIKKFDVENGTAFSTYAVWWIKQRINSYILSYGHTIHFSRNALKKLKDVKDALQELTDENEKEPTLKELSKHMNMPLGELQEILEAKKCTSVSSLNLKITEEEDAELGDFVVSGEEPIETQVERKILFQNLMQLIEESNLKEREKDIIIKRFGLNGSRIYSIDKLSNIYGISTVRIRQIEKNALQKLRMTIIRSGLYVGYSNESSPMYTKIKR